MGLSTGVIVQLMDSSTAMDTASSLVCSTTASAPNCMLFATAVLQQVMNAGIVFCMLLQCAHKAMVPRMSSPAASDWTAAAVRPWCCLDDAAHPVSSTPVRDIEPVDCCSDGPPSNNSNTRNSPQRGCWRCNLSRNQACAQEQQKDGNLFPGPAGAVTILCAATQGHWGCSCWQR